jgi:hypothetical protein
MATSIDSEEKLVWLGIQTNSAKVNKLEGDVVNLKNTVGDWSDFVSLVNNNSSYSGLRDSLVNNFGWDSNNAQAFVDRLDREFASYTDFKDKVNNQFNSYSDLQAVFGQATIFQGDQVTSSGQPAAGIRVHESDGVSYSGVSVPAGTTEVFGVRIEFSQQNPPRGTTDPVTYANLTTNDADNTVVRTNDITISADVTNPNGFQVDAAVPLTEDGSVLKQQQVSFDANETKSVSFTVAKSSVFCGDYAIGNLSPVLICWKHAGVGTP